MFGTNTFSFLKIFLNQFVDSEDGKSLYAEGQLSVILFFH